MGLRGLGTRQRGFRLPILGLTSALAFFAALVLFAVELARFAQNRDLLQTDITVGGIPVTGLTLQEAMAAVETVYNQPVELTYRDSPILLNPADVGFRVNIDLLRGEVQSRLSGTNDYWGDFWNYLWRRPSAPVVVNLNATYSEAELRDYLTDLARRYDSGTGIIQFDATSASFGTGASGTRLDVERSIPLVEEAMYRAINRRATLASVQDTATKVTMDTLRQTILNYLAVKGIASDGKDGIASVVIIDLETGEELSINPDVAYSAMSTIKIPILLNAFRQNRFEIPVEIRWLMGASILCSANDASNRLMSFYGADDMATGLRQVTSTIQTLGARNSFISANILVDPKARPTVIEAPRTEPDKQFNTRPDPWSQTTAIDMAILMQELYDCAEYNSGLRGPFATEYTQLECRQMLELLSGNVIGRLIELGVPPGTRVAHKNGWGGAPGGASGANVSDVAIVYSPAKTYVLSIYMWEAQANPYGLGTLRPWEAIEEISRIVYNYYNPDRPMVTPRVPENPLGAIDCVMPNLGYIERLDLNNINNGRFNPDGTLVADACYGYPVCTQK